MPRRVARLTLICAYEPCQTPFEIVPNRLARAKYCSKRCHMLAVHPQAGMTLADRFWEKVTKGTPEECWPWHAAKGHGGYGTIYVSEQGRTVGAHVVSWFLHTGEWPAEGEQILHDCPTGDRRDCVNFAHLWKGTQLDNMHDMHAKGRTNKTWMKVSDAQAEEMLALYQTGEWTYKQLAERYNVSEGTPPSILKSRMHLLALSDGQAPTLPPIRIRAARGERIGNSKITDAQWQEALLLYATGEWSVRRLARRYGVNKSSIQNRLKHQL